MTMPLSRTRSSTSIRLVPPDVLSTAIVAPLGPPLPGGCFQSSPRECLEIHFELPHAFRQALVLAHQRIAGDGREVPVVLPPVEADLLRLVDRTDQEADPDREQFDLGERHLDVPGDDEALVE